MWHLIMQVPYTKTAREIEGHLNPIDQERAFSFTSLQLGERTVHCVQVERIRIEIAPDPFA